MGRFNKQYIAFFFSYFFLSAFPSALMFSKGSCQSIGTHAKEYTEIKLLWSPFCFWNGQGNKNKLLTCNLHLTFTVIICPYTGPNDLKFLSGNLPFWVSLGKVTFLAAKP